MIVPKMTKAEILKEIDRDSDWVLDRQPGIWKKYAKKIARAKYGTTLLGQTRYTTERKNNIWVLWMCEKWKDETGIYSLMMHEVMSPRGYEYIVAIEHETLGSTTITFTPHAIDRLKERSGMDFPELTRYCATKRGGYLCITTYEYEGEKRPVYSLGEFGLFVLSDGPWGFIAQTYVNKDLLSDAQTRTLEKDAEEKKLFRRPKHNNVNFFHPALKVR